MISIIIPVLNEADSIVSLLEHICINASEENISEIIIVDGGSTDKTKVLTEDFSENSAINIRLFDSEKGRAKQMNKGVGLATGNILYFLHADSFPPKNFDNNIISEVTKGNKAGCFRMKFDSNHPLLTFSEWFTQFNFRFCRGGDQSLFITKDAFFGLGGFNESFTIYEDCEFIDRIYNSFGFTIINDYVITSARKYTKNGAWKLQYHFTMIHLKKWLGASPTQLNNYYIRNIVS